MTTKAPAQLAKLARTQTPRTPPALSAEVQARLEAIYTEDLREVAPTCRTLREAALRTEIPLPVVSTLFEAHGITLGRKGWPALDTRTGEILVFLARGAASNRAIHDAVLKNGRGAHGFLHLLERRGLVERVPGCQPQQWCTTAEGQRAAETLQREAACET